jgi:hypothetical protein
MALASCGSKPAMVIDFLNIHGAFERSGIRARSPPL